MNIVVGLDEVGRGSWAGPLVAGAVILAKPISGLKDSKKLSKKQRQELNEIIQNEAMDIGLGWVAPSEVDKLGLSLAVKRAMELAVGQITTKYDKIIIDGHHNFLSDYPNSRSIINADDLIACVSAASIVAKVARDDFMKAAALKYPNYGFETHVGYGTPRHLAAIKKHGICEIHRRSYRPIKLALV